MPKVPRDVKPKELVKALSRLGFVEKGQSGSHLKMVHPDGRWTTIPVHSKPVPTGTLRAILRQADISIESLLENI